MAKEKGTLSSQERTDLGKSSNLREFEAKALVLKLKRTLK